MEGGSFGAASIIEFPFGSMENPEERRTKSPSGAVVATLWSDVIKY